MSLEAVSVPDDNVVSLEEAREELLVTGENLDVLLEIMALTGVPCKKANLSIALRGARDTLKGAKARGGLVHHTEGNATRSSIVLPLQSHAFQPYLGVRSR